MNATFLHAGAQQPLNKIRPEQTAMQPDFNGVVDEVCEPCALKRKRVEDWVFKTAHQPERAIKRAKLTAQSNTSTSTIIPLNRHTTPPPPGYVPAVLADQPYDPVTKTPTISTNNPYPATFDSSITSFLKSEFNNITSEQIAHGQKRVFEAMAGTGPFAGYR